MQRINFDCSTKNIPIPTNKEYHKRLIEMTGKLINRMRWRAYHFLKPSTINNEQQTYGFKSKKTPPQVPELNEFETKMTNMIHNIEFRTPRPSEFQHKLSEHTEAINKDANLYIPADKTTNFYRMTTDNYKSLLKKNIEKEYKKAPVDTVSEINNQAKDIARNLNLSDRIETLAQNEAFISLKDHKDNFSNNPTCRLINPTKSEIGKVSKCILDRINKDIINKTGVKQWKSTKDTLNWFNSITGKERHSFITFDIVNFYPSISSKLLEDALKFAEAHTDIPAQEKEIIWHAKQSLLYNGNIVWTKKNSSNSFDVTMGSFDGAETCELVGSYLLHQLPETIRNQVGLYRDDGLGAFENSPQCLERIKKQICKVFKDNGLKITIDANKKIVNFLDVTLDLNKGTHEPYLKPNNKPLYVHNESNHPPSIIKNIPLAINKRLNELSSNKESFDKASPEYQRALEKSGYNYDLKFEATNNQATERRSRRRNITWYNPPFSKNVATNVGRKFRNIVKESFKSGHPLQKIFNKNTLKISYSCMPNLERKINTHNKSILRENPQQSERMCNCRSKPDCPLKGECLSNNVIYQATVKTNDTKETYIGLTGDRFKTRFNNHTCSFRDNNKRNSTELSKHIWSLKDNNIRYAVDWKIMARANPYSNIGKKCNLCIMEKYFIICKPETCTLNKRNELASACRHANKFLIKNG